MNIPSFESYGNYSSDNYGVNSLMFQDSEGNTFWYSYKTLVAFKAFGKDIVCLKNYWKQTTGKHLNRIQPDKKKRVTQEVFDQILSTI